jgi:hypothetical protein
MRLIVVFDRQKCSSCVTEPKIKKMVPISKKPNQQMDQCLIYVDSIHVFLNCEFFWGGESTRQL